MRRFTHIITILILALHPPVAHTAPLKVHYLVRPIPPTTSAAASLRVVIHVSGVKGEKSVRFQMPVWSPGDYHVQNHGKYVQDVSSSSAPDHSNKVDHPDQNTWDVSTDGFDVVSISYNVHNTPPGFFSENVKVMEKWAFYNGPAAYMYVAGHKEVPVTLQMSLPEGWKGVVTPLDPAKVIRVSKDAQFSAPDYDTLSDSPVLAGDFTTREFTAAGRPHTIAFFRRQPGMDFDSFPPVLKKIAEEQNRMMGGPPYKRYVFFFDVGGPGGGLEHLDSTRISVGRGATGRSVTGVAAHEFFHLWNVKRIRPAVLGPFDYINPPKTANLWFSEGVTSYYGDLSCVRAGLTTEDDYLQGLGRTINWYQSSSARKRVTADESSYRVWEANNSQGYGGLSYYMKGDLMGLCLDLKIRGLSSNRTSLDTVMRDLMARTGLPKPGFAEDGIREACIRAAGTAMGPFYDLLARSTEDMPFVECLRYAGLTLTPQGIVRDGNADNAVIQIRKSWLSGQ